LVDSEGESYMAVVKVGWRGWEGVRRESSGLTDFPASQANNSAGRKNHRVHRVANAAF
jgi:hypothetical protein